ncbi:MAG: tetratricopeptide repeat protein [Opitutaceae bacterium]|nr:tetratricopeptide repeat protein [Opitutaceae bacterium]
MTARAESAGRRTAIGAVLFIATLLLFSRAGTNGFVNYDDPEYVTKNDHVRAGMSLAGIRWALTSGAASNWHPLTWISHLADGSLFGLDARGHHLTSVLLHAVNAWLLFAALWRLTRAWWPSAMGAALFAWHPLRVESVAWIAERKDVLSGFFFFLTLWAYAIYVERRRAGGRMAARYYWSAVGACALGLMAKPMLVTTPCVLLLLDFWPLRRIRGLPPESAPPSSLKQEPGGGTAQRMAIGTLFLEKLPFFALAVGSSVVTYLVQKEGGSVSVALGFGARLANAVVALARYVGKIFWPIDLAVLYPHPGSWSAAAVAGSILLVAVLTAFAWVQRTKRPWAAVGWLWFVGTLVPVLGLVQVGLQSMADRYTYIPGVGLQLAVVWAGFEVVRGTRMTRAAGIAAVVLGGALMSLTWRQLGVWKDSYTLFDHAIAVTEDNYLAYNNRGLFQFENGRREEGMADYRRALAINPAYPDAKNNLGHALAETGRAAEAVPFYRAALRARPDHSEIRNNLGNALSDIGAVDEAIEHYEFVLTRQPRHVNALNGLGVALAMKGRLADALARFDTVLQLEPNNVSAHSNRGNACAMLGRADEAIRHYRRALALAGDDARTYYNLANVLRGQGQLAAAADNYQRAVQLQPVNPDAHASLGFVLAQLGRRETAIQHLRTALQQRPEFPQAKAWLDTVSAASPAK